MREGTTAANREHLKAVHDGSPYYEQAEGWIDVFWQPDSVFFALFQRLDLTDCIDLACGHGRHTAQIVDRVGRVTLVDINKSNITACRERFAGRDNVDYYETGGSDLQGLSSGRFTSLFCYDAMVHFEAADTISYIHEIYRVLTVGGMALLHYSNYEAAPEKPFNENPHWRNFFSSRMMHHFATRAGFKILSSQILPWPPPGGVRDIDGVVLLRKE